MMSILSTQEKNHSHSVSVSPSAALPKEYQRIGKAFQNLSSVFTSSGYQGTTVNTNMIKVQLTCELFLFTSLSLVTPAKDCCFQHM